MAAFQQLSMRRASNGMGPCSISEAQVLSWQHLFRVRLSPWEIETLFLIDVVAMREMARQTAG